VSEPAARPTIAVAVTGERLASLAPGGFAAVMATGIVSIAANLLGHDAIGQALFLVNAVLYPAVWAAFLTRVLLMPGTVLREFASHERGPGFLTIVAATAVLGSQCASYRMGVILLPWLLGMASVLWAVLLYGFLAAITLQQSKPTVPRGLSGSWLLIVVATESLAVLGSYVAPLAAAPGPLIFASFAAFLLGGVFYLMLITLIVQRFAFEPMSAGDLEGPWWINMGAVAIATLAGSRLVQLPQFDVHVALLRQIAGPVTVILWATATFWIPLLVILFAWKHLVRHEPVRYEPGQWSMVFPLGMYAASTEIFSQAAGLPFLHPIAAGFFWIGFGAWVVTSVGLLRSLSRLARSG
jgi:tellurite resistance protein TehA-like permease